MPEMQFREPPLVPGHPIQRDRAAQIERMFRYLTIAAYVAAVFTPALTMGDGFSYWGIAALVFGWGLGFAELIAWLANPLIYIAILLLWLKQPGWSLFFSATAVLCTFSTFQVDELASDASGAMSPVVGYGPGFYLWFASCALPGIGSLTTIAANHRKNKAVEAEIIE